MFVSISAYNILALISRVNLYLAKQANIYFNNLTLHIAVISMSISIEQNRIEQNSVYIYTAPFTKHTALRGTRWALPPDSRNPCDHRSSQAYSMTLEDKAPVAPCPQKHWHFLSHEVIASHGPKPAVPPANIPIQNEHPNLCSCCHCSHVTNLMIHQPQWRENPALYHTIYIYLEYPLSCDCYELIQLTCECLDTE